MGGILADEETAEAAVKKKANEETALAKKKTEEEELLTLRHSFAAVELYKQLGESGEDGCTGASPVRTKRNQKREF